MVVTEASKLVEPPCSETSQEFRSSSRHLGTAYNECVCPDRRSSYKLFEHDRPFARKSGTLGLRQISNQGRRFALPNHISTQNYNRIVKLTNDCTSFGPRRALPVKIGIHIGKPRPVRDVREQGPDPPTRKRCTYGIGEGGRHRATFVALYHGSASEERHIASTIIIGQRLVLREKSTAA